MDQKTGKELKELSKILLVIFANPKMPDLLSTYSKITETDNRDVQYPIQ
jgi:hypothetical protein